MAIQSEVFSTSYGTRTFSSTKHIATKQHMAIWLKRVSDSAWIQASVNSFELINNSAVLDEAPNVSLYSQVEIRVADEPDELGTSQSDITIVASLATEISEVVSQVIPNLPEILLADDNAAIATTKAIEASTSEANALTYRNSAQGYASNALANANIATDKASEASASATSASNSATTATTKAGIATTKASEASTSASNALSSEVSASASATAAQGYATSINPSTLVHNIGDESIDGVKTFLKFPLTPSSAPTANYELANKKYVDDNKTTVVDATSSAKGVNYKNLLAEYIVSGSAVTSIDFSGLDINTHKSYRVEIDIVGVGGGNVYIFVNGDTTITNYYHQALAGNSTSVSAQRVNEPRIGNISNGASSKFNVNVSLINNKMVYNALSNYLDWSTVQSYFSVGSKTTTVTNITQLTFTSSVASNIGVGSKIRIYRGDV